MEIAFVEIYSLKLRKIWFWVAAGENVLLTKNEVFH